MNFGTPTVEHVMQYFYFLLVKKKKKNLTNDMSL